MQLNKGLNQRQSKESYKKIKQIKIDAMKRNRNVQKLKEKFNKEYNKERNHNSK